MTARWKKVLGISLATLALLWMASCFSYVGELKSNHAWIVFDPSLGQGLASPFADKSDPNILYLIFAQRNGAAVKINLKEKSTTSVQFPSDKGDPETTLRYYFVNDRKGKGGGYTVHGTPGKDNTTEFLPFWDELRGRVISYPYPHLYGFPFPHELGIKHVEARFGTWYVIEQRGGRRVELLRTRVWNSELSGGDSIGDLELSPDRKWVVFRLAGYPERIFIFNREAPGPEAFQ